MRHRLVCALLILIAAAPAAARAQVTAIRAGHLVDPAAGTATPDQIILTERDRITAIGPDLAIPPGATVIDLSGYYVLPGMVDAHDHLALTYDNGRDGGSYYLTTILDSTPKRAIQAFSNGFQKLASGFTVVRDLGNAGNYADTALRETIEEGWVPGPTIVNSGIIIGGMGGQFRPTPERFFAAGPRGYGVVYPEYLDADTHDEIIKAIRQNILFGARVIKIMVDSKPYGYTVEEMKLFIDEAAKSGLKVAGHVQTKAGALRAIEAGIWSIEHSGAMDDEVHRLMAARGVWRVGTETPRGNLERVGAGIRNAYEHGVKMAFSTDADYWVRGMTRGEYTISFLDSWNASGIPDAEILKILTTNGFEVCDIQDRRGAIEPGLRADMIAVRANPLEDVDTLRDVRFVMKEGRVFKRDGVVTPMAFFHGGPAGVWGDR